MFEKNKESFFTTMAVIMVLVTVIFAALGIYNILSGIKKKDAVENDIEKIVNVSVKTISKEVFIEELTLNADLMNLNPCIDVLCPVSGTVINNNARLGDKVEKGSVLGVIDASGVGVSYKPSEIISPIQGVVVENNAVLNQKVDAQFSLYSIQGKGDFVLSASVSEADAGRLRVGATGTFTVAGDDNKHYCTLRYISPNVNPSTRRVEIEADVDKEDDNYENLRNGNYVVLNLVKARHENVYVLPNSAIKTYMGMPVVYKVGEDNITKRIDVNVTLRTESYSIVEGDLMDGDRIVIQGNPGDSALVKVL